MCVALVACALQPGSLVRLVRPLASSSPLVLVLVRSFFAFLMFVLRALLSVIMRRVGVKECVGVKEKGAVGVYRILSAVAHLIPVLSVAPSVCASVEMRKRNIYCA